MPMYNKLPVTPAMPVPDDQPSTSSEGYCFKYASNTLSIHSNVSHPSIHPP